MKKTNKTYKEYLENLVSLLRAEGEQQPDDDQVLKSAGFEPGDVGKKYLSVAQKVMAKSPHNWRNQARNELENARKALIPLTSTGKVKKSRSELVDAISALITGQRLRVGSAYRNLTEQTDEDLESLLRQLEYIASQKSSLDE
jgi:hypothetical protein